MQRRFDLVLERGLLVVLVSATWLGAAGCVNVAPSQRRYLAEEVMNLDYAARSRSLQEHMLQYREGSVGGNGGGGSGCGCN